MKRLGTASACSIAVMAALLVSAAGASAKLPEWGQCLPTAGGSGGKYADAGCIVPVRKVHGAYLGGYEWTPLGRHNAQISLASEAFSFETASGKAIECVGLNSESIIRLENEYLGPHQKNGPGLFFGGCHSSEGTGSGYGCKNASEREEISDQPEWAELQEENEETEELEGPIKGLRQQLGFIEGKGTNDPVVGLSYTALNGSDEDERFFEPIICSSPNLGTVWIGGQRKGGNAVIGALSPADVNVMKTTFTQTFSASAPGVQTPERFQGHGRAVMQEAIESHWEPVAWKGTLTYSMESGEAYEIKATP